MLLSTTTDWASKVPASWSTTSMTIRVSAPPSSEDGVPTQISTALGLNSPSAVISVENRSCPLCNVSLRISSNPGSKNGTLACLSRLIFQASFSMHRTSWPFWAISADVTSPTYPAPMQPTRIARPLAVLIKKSMLP